MSNSSFRHRNLEDKEIKEDDKCEEIKNLVGKSNREGLGVLPLKKFKKTMCGSNWWCTIIISRTI
jgi:hypothetical protein